MGIGTLVRISACCRKLWSHASSSSSMCCWVSNSRILGSTSLSEIILPPACGRSGSSWFLVGLNLFGLNPHSWTQTHLHEVHYLQFGAQVISHHILGEAVAGEQLAPALILIAARNLRPQPGSVLL